MMNHLLFPLLCLIVITATTSGFSPAHSIVKKVPYPPSFLFLVSGGENNDIPSDDSTEYSGSVDWDAEWKKVVEKKGQLESGGERPGKDFYKSEAEITAIQAANKATKKITNVGSTVTNALPDIRSLSGDWRFWIGILALVSVGLSVLTAPPANIVPTGLEGDSFYM